MKDTAEWKYPPGLKHGLTLVRAQAVGEAGEPIRLFEHLHQTYGNMSCYMFMGTPIVFVNDPEYVREILVTQERFVREGAHGQADEASAGRRADHVRRAVPHCASGGSPRRRSIASASRPTRRKLSLRRWRRVSGLRDGETIEIAGASMGLSLEIVARTLFDTEVDADIRSINDEVNAIMEMYNFIVAFPMLERFIGLPVPRLVRFRQAKARLDAVVDRIIAEHRAAIAKADEEGAEGDRGDLLWMLLSSRDEVLDEAGQPTGTFVTMTDAQVRDEVLTIFLAGYETVANGLTWTWYLLSQHPEVEAKLHAELDAVLGTGDARRLPKLEDYSALRYTEMVFAEAMRLYPPAWAMGRMSTRPVTLGPYRIPPGAHFFMSQYMMGRTAEYYPDPMKFEPERFSPEGKAGRPKYAYFPFGGGSRQCIGESFAWMEGVFSIATLAQRWRFRYADASPPVPQAKITLRPRDPMHMVAERRA